MSDFKSFPAGFSTWIVGDGLWLLVVLIMLTLVSAGFIIASLIWGESDLIAFGAIGILVAALTVTIGVNTYSDLENPENIATYNIAQKYNAEKITFGNWDSSSRTLAATYSDKTSGTVRNISFAFAPNDVEPFLVKNDTPESDFSKITKDIEKAK